MQKIKPILKTLSNKKIFEIFKHFLRIRIDSVYELEYHFKTDRGQLRVWLNRMVNDGTLLFRGETPTDYPKYMFNYDSLYLKMWDEFKPIYAYRELYRYETVLRLKMLVFLLDTSRGRELILKIKEGKSSRQIQVETGMTKGNLDTYIKRLTDFDMVVKDKNYPILTTDYYELIEIIKKLENVN